MYTNEAQERLDLFDKFFAAALTGLVVEDVYKAANTVAAAAHIANLAVIRHYERRNQIFKDVKL